MTGIIADSMYEFFVDNDALPVEQKGCRRKSRGTKDQLLIVKMVLADCKRKHKNLAMSWVDYKKAYDMVPHSLIIESLKMAQVTFLQKSMVNWKTELTSCGETLGDTRRQPVSPYLCCLHGTLDQDPTRSQSWIYLRRRQNKSFVLYG